MKTFRTGFLPHLGFIAILLLFSVIYYGDMITRLPFGIHEWAQGDRLSLAINFYDNGLNFFKPATHSQYSINGIVGVEFPIESYVAGALGYVFGRDSISTCFRITGLLLGWMGLYFLFRMVYDRTRDFLLAVVPPLIIFCSPTLVCYTVNYLPDPAAVSVVFGAFYFFLQYADTGVYRKLLISLSLLTLAVLIKASTATYWLGILCYGLYYEAIIRKEKKRLLVLIGAALLSCIIIVTDHWYIRYLNTTYNSTLFWAHFRPFADWEDYNEYIRLAFKETWMKEYFLLAEYPLMVFIISIGISILLKTKSLKHYLIPAIVFLPCSLLLFYLFGAQLTVHDYYILAIFFPLIAYLLVTSMIGIGHRFRLSHIRELRAGIIAAMLLVFFLADHQIYNRFHNIGGYNDNYSSYWLMDAAPLIDSVKIPKTEHIVVAGDYPPNLALVYFDRKGYVILPDVWDDNIGRATQLLKEKHLRYLVLRENSLKNAIVKDSAGVAAYDMVILAKGTAILRLKP